MYLVHTRYIYTWYILWSLRWYIPGIYQVYTRYIPGIETRWYILDIYQVYIAHIADIGIYLVYTRYIPGFATLWGFQMTYTYKISVSDLYLNVSYRYLHVSIQYICTCMYLYSCICMYVAYYVLVYAWGYARGTPLRLSQSRASETVRAGRVCVAHIPIQIKRSYF